MTINCFWYKNLLRFFCETLKMWTIIPSYFYYILKYIYYKNFAKKLCKETRGSLTFRRSNWYISIYIISCLLRVCEHRIPYIFFLLLLFPKERLKSRERERSKIYFFLASVSSPLLHFRPHGRCCSATYQSIFCEGNNPEEIDWIYLPSRLCFPKRMQIYSARKRNRGAMYRKASGRNKSGT